MIGEAVRKRICLIARTSPASWSTTAFSTWSLSKLREHLLDRGTVAAISRETLRRILHPGGVSRQGTATWKASTDPDFMVRMHRVLDLYDHPPDDGRVICVDEFGPLNLMPRKGKVWRPVGSPRRSRATYNRRHGVMPMLAALDLTIGKVHYRIRRRKRHVEFLDLPKALRARWPGQKLYIVADNFSPHRHPDVLRWATDNAVEPVFPPTCSSWLNWIEAEFTALRCFALNGTDHHSHAEQNAAIAAYIRRRNTRAQPKTGFATDPPIRIWTDYPAKVALRSTTCPTPSGGRSATAGGRCGERRARWSATRSVTTHGVRSTRWRWSRRSRADWRTVGWSCRSRWPPSWTTSVRSCTSGSSCPPPSWSRRWAWKRWRSRAG